MNTAPHPWLATYEELGLDWHEVPAIPDQTLAGYIRDFGKAFPDREALVYLGHGISYAELDRLTDRFANVLLSLGCDSGDVLGLHQPNNPQFVVALLAAARLGMVTTCISPLLTADEIVHQANDAGARVILTLDALFDHAISPLAGRVETLEAVVVTGATDLLPGAPNADTSGMRMAGTRVTGFMEALEAADDTPVERDTSLDDVLYLQYTGGTTGMPKGAQLSSRNLLVNNAQTDLFYGYRLGGETVASAFPLFHIGGGAILFNALRMASTFFLFPDPRDIGSVVSEMRQRPPSVIAAVPALYQMLVGDQGFRELDFSDLRIALSGAAPFSESEVKRLEAVIGPGKFCEVYGMTETGPVQTLNPARRLKPGSVGIPLPGTEVRIMDAESGDRIMPAGEAGEIVVTGPQVMKGYLAMPEATADSLREHDGKLWMHTGDIGEMDEEGYVRVCDRSKDMLIVGGYKVFSVEVENKVQTLPLVEMCAVVGRPDEKRPGNDIVQLHVQPTADFDGDRDTAAEQIQAFCREQMAPYKVPKEVFFVEAIPLTSVGKIDKKALRQPAR